MQHTDNCKKQTKKILQRSIIDIHVHFIIFAIVDSKSKFISMRYSIETNVN